MTSTSFNVGLGGTSRSSSKVLKPPGGGSSDIFGAAEAQQSPRKVKQYMASNISLTDGAPAPSGTGPGSTSSAASTASSGETPSPGSPTGSPTRNGTAQAGQAEQTGQSSVPQEGPQEAPQGGQGDEVQVEVQAAGKAPDGEPRGRQFQMESHFSLGYDKPATPVKQAEGEAVRAAQDGNPVTGEGYKSTQAPIRNRVPPGGYSSGLW